MIHRFRDFFNGMKFSWRCTLCLKPWQAVLIDILVRATILADDRDKDDERRKTPPGGSV